MKEQDDAALVRQCLEGQTGAFEKFIDKYQKTIFNVALRMVNNRDDAEDVAQAVFVKAYQNLKSFNPKFRFFSWLYRMAVNESLNFYRQKARHQGLDENLESREARPDQSYERNEQTENIEMALMRIGEEYRSVIVLRHFLELSYKEIGEICDVPEKTVKSRLYTARHALKDILTGMGIRHA